MSKKRSDASEEPIEQPSQRTAKSTEQSQIESHNGIILEEYLILKELEIIFASLPEAVIACDQQGNIIFLNGAAFKLFEIAPDKDYLGTSYRAFLRHYELYDERHQPIFFAPWLVSPPIHRSVERSTYQQTLMLKPISGRKIPIELTCSPLLNSRKQVMGMVSVFHEITPRYQKALQLQRVYEAVQALNEAITTLPEQFQCALPQSLLLLSPPVLYIARQLVDVIRQVVNFWRVSLVGCEVKNNHLYYVAGSGFTPEQEHRRQDFFNDLPFVEVVGDAVFAQLLSNQVVIIGSDRFHKLSSALALEPSNILILPLFVQQRLCGALSMYKQGWDSGYTEDEIELVRAVATQATMIIDCIGCLWQTVNIQARELVLQEVDRLSKEFLTLASHELRTPLTGIKGNLQLAQRQLEALKQQIAENPENITNHIERAQQSLASAAQSTQVQERIMRDIIDDARIQANQLDLLLRPYDLLPLVSTSLEKVRRINPDREISMQLMPLVQSIPVQADAERITQVLNIYLTNALNYSPAERPVTVQLKLEAESVRVSVHDQGPGIPIEEQESIWKRFYRAKGNGVQNELDLSLGLSFYICRALIERHHGQVGLESQPGHGTTFWFTLPLDGSEHTERK